MTQAEIELLPKVAEVVGWPETHDGFERISGGWCRTAYFDDMTEPPETYAMLDDEMELHMARRIADWIDDDELEYRRITLRGGRGIEVWLHERWIGQGATRIEAEMRAVMAWAEANP